MKVSLNNTAQKQYGKLNEPLLGQVYKPIIEPASPEEIRMIEEGMKERFSPWSEIRR